MRQAAAVYIRMKKGCLYLHIIADDNLSYSLRPAMTYLSTIACAANLYINRKNNPSATAMSTVRIYAVFPIKKVICSFCLPLLPV